jgi:hypothetical protein
MVQRIRFISGAKMALGFSVNSDKIV